MYHSESESELKLRTTKPNLSIFNSSKYFTGIIVLHHILYNLISLISYLCLWFFLTAFQQRVHVVPSPRTVRGRETLSITSAAAVSSRITRPVFYR